MHKCSNCGQEYEGKFCPNCGAQWQENKTCPNCGTQLVGGVKFCPECGYSFTDAKPSAQTPAKENSAFKQKLVKVWAWIKSHLKIVIPSVAGLVVLIIMLSLIPTFIAVPSNGTYYGYSSSGEYDTSTYVILKNYKWKDDEGSSGKYKLSGKNITITETEFGETWTTKGTVKNGVLALDTDEDGKPDEIYVRKNHKHKYGGWKTDYEATCAMEGQKSHSCACGFKDRRVIEKLPHTLGDWGYDYNNHWKICSVCGNKINAEEHSGDVKCLICTFPLIDTTGLKFTLNSAGDGYTVSDSGTAYNNSTIRIPMSYENLPVTAIGRYAFNGCHNLTRITIPDSVTSIGVWAFDGCSSLARITIPDSVTEIGYGAFRGCTSLNYNEYDNAKYLGNAGNPYLALIEAKNTLITSCNINENTIIIYGSAFEDCSGLTSVTIGNGVTTIGNNAFDSCSSLTSISIPDRESISDLHPTISY